MLKNKKNGKKKGDYYSRLDRFMGFGILDSDNINYKVKNRDLYDDNIDEYGLNGEDTKMIVLMDDGEKKDKNINDGHGELKMMEREGGGGGGEEDVSDEMLPLTAHSQISISSSGVDNRNDEYLGLNGNNNICDISRGVGVHTGFAFNYTESLGEDMNRDRYRTLDVSDMSDDVNLNVFVGGGFDSRRITPKKYEMRMAHSKAKRNKR
jgi:hypothetical protein